jgi:lysophospholipase L1-like esterase
MKQHESLWMNWLLFGILTIVTLFIITPATAENSAIVPEPRENPEWLQRHHAMNGRVKEGNVNLLWIGDSIVERWENKGKHIWNKYYAGRGAVNLGIGGDRTQHVLWRLDHGNIDGISPKLAIVMIGQNNGPDNSAEEIAEGITAIVMKLRQKLPTTKILLLAIFFRGKNPNDEQVKLVATNTIISKLEDGRHIFYLNINNIFLLPDGSIQGALMPDYEHPNKRGCKVWAEAIEPKVAELLGETPIIP